MKKFQIESTAGVVYGIYEGETREDAFRAMAIDAGHSPEDIGEWPLGGPDDWIIEEVSEDMTVIFEEDSYDRQD